MTMLTILAIGALTDKPQISDPQRIVNCGFMTGGINNGTLVQTCMPGMILLRPSATEADRPIRSSDGSYLHEFIFESPRTTSFQTTICSPNLVDFTIVGLSGMTVAIKKLQDDKKNCVTRQFYRVTGTFSLVVHTRNPEAKLSIKSVFIPTLTPVAMASPNTDSVPDVVTPFIPVEVMTPPEVFLPNMISPMVEGVGGSPMNGLPDIVPLTH